MNTLKQLGTLSTTVEAGAKNQGATIFVATFFHCGGNIWGALILVQDLALTTYMPLRKDQEL